jgi:hypothetical protein
MYTVFNPPGNGLERGENNEYTPFKVVFRVEAVYTSTTLV